MGDSPNPSRHEPISLLLTGILDDLRKLLRLELQLAQARAQDKLVDLGRAGAYFAAALILLIPTSLLMALTMAFGLAECTGWKLWLCHLVVGLVLAVGATLLALMGLRAARVTKAEPEKEVSTSEALPPWIEK